MKFQVSDEVRVVKTPGGLPEGELVGEIHKVTAVDNSGMPYELSNGFWYREEDIELVVDHDVLMQKVLERNNKPELVNHPDHYQGNKFEVIDIIEDYELNFTLGSAVKYILRAGKKDDKNIDLKKAIWMLEREIENENN